MPFLRSLLSVISMTLNYVGLGLIFLLSVKKYKEFCVISNCFVCLTLLSSLYAVFCLITYSNPYTDLLSTYFPKISDYAEGFSDDIRGVTARITGVFSHPLVLGEFSLLAFCLIMVLIDEFKNKTLIILLLIITAFALLLSGTRSCILSLLVFLTIYFSSYFFNIKYWVGTLLVVLPLTLWSYSKLDTNTKSLIEASIFFYDESKSSQISGSTVSLREKQMEYTLNQDAKVLTIGNGPGYITYSSKIKKRSSVMAGYESILFAKIAEEGLLGLTMFFIVVMVLFKCTIRGTTALFKKKVFAFYISYIVCILMTNIQGTGHIFFLGCAMLLMYGRYIEKSSIGNILQTEISN